MAASCTTGTGTASCPLRDDAGSDDRLRAASVHALLCRRRVAQLSDQADVVLQLDSSRRVELDLLESLSDHIVGLPLALLGCLDRGGLVKVAFVVDVELVEGVGQRKDVALLELRKLPAREIMVSMIGEIRANRRASSVLSAYL